MKMTRLYVLIVLAVAAAAGLLLSGNARAQTTLTAVEHQVTSSSFYETEPKLGNDGVSDLVVYTSWELLNNGLPGPEDIWYQRLNPDGSTRGAPVQVTSDPTHDDLAGGVSGNYIVYSAYDRPYSGTVTVMLYNIATGQHRALSDYGIVRDPKIHGDYVVWLQGTSSASEVILYDINSNVSTSLAGPVPPASKVKIGSRYVVWSSWVDTGYRDIWVFDFDLNTRYRLTNTPTLDERYPSTSGDWVAWMTFDGVKSGIEAYNGSTGESRTILSDAGAQALFPSVDGNLIAWEEDRATGNFDVWVHRLDTSESFQVTFEPHYQYLNDLYGNLVAYVDARFGNEDILT